MIYLLLDVIILLRYMHNIKPDRLLNAVGFHRALWNIIKSQLGYFGFLVLVIVRLLFCLVTYKTKAEEESILKKLWISHQILHY